MLNRLNENSTQESLADFLKASFLKAPGLLLRVLLSAKARFILA